MKELKFLGKPAPVLKWVSVGMQDNEKPSIKIPMTDTSEARLKHLEGALKEASELVIIEWDDLQKKTKEIFIKWLLNHPEITGEIYESDYPICWDEKDTFRPFIAFLLRETLGEKKEGKK